MQPQRSGLAALDFFDNVDESEYGFEDEGLVTDEDDAAVVIPECRFALDQYHVATLVQTVNPLTISDNYGIELYQQTLAFIPQFMALINKKSENTTRTL